MFIYERRHMYMLFEVFQHLDRLQMKPKTQTEKEKAFGQNAVWHYQNQDRGFNTHKVKLISTSFQKVDAPARTVIFLLHRKAPKSGEIRGTDKHFNVVYSCRILLYP